MVPTEGLGVDNVTRWFGEERGAIGLRAAGIRRRTQRPSVQGNQEGGGYGLEEVKSGEKK